MTDFLHGEILDTFKLSDLEKKAMFSLLTTYFDGIILKNFESNLKEKDNVLLLRDENSEIRGFTTIQLLETIIDSQLIKGVFSGDTIIDKAYWAKNDLAIVWGKYMLQTKEKFLDVPFYWFLISSGYRTYRFLPTFFKEFIPRYGRPPDPFQQRVLDSFARLKFGDDYNPETGIIHFSYSDERLKPAFARIEESKLKNPHINYFVQRNPYYYQGDELACLAEIHVKNVQPLTLRMFGRAQNESS